MRHARPRALRLLPAAVAVLALLILPTAAVAKEGPAGAKPSANARTQAVKEAFAQGDTATVEKLAKETDVDRWLVVNRLVAAEAWDVAAAYAKAAGDHIDVKALPAYVEARKQAGVDPKRTEAFNAAIGKLNSGQVQAAFPALEALHAGSTKDAIQILAMQATGDLLPRMGKPREGAARLREAAVLAEEMGWTQKAAMLHLKCAIASWQGSDIGSTAKAFDDALRLETARGDRVRMATMLSNMAIIDNAVGENERAVERYKEALAQQEELGDTMGVARTLGNMAAAQQEMGAMKAALENLERSLEMREKLGDKEGMAVSIAGIGRHYLSMGRSAKALDHFQRGRTMLLEIGKRHTAAISLSSIGHAYTMLGDYAKARGAHEQARAEFQSLGDAIGAAKSLGDLAQLDSKLGNHERALERFKEAYEVAKQSGGRMDLAGQASNLGLAYYWMQEYDKARELYGQAIDGLEATGRHGLAHKVRANLAHLLVSEGKAEEALPLFEASLAAAKARKDRVSEAMTESAMGRTLMTLRRFDDARGHLKTAIRRARSLRMPQVRFEAVAHLAAMELDAGNPDASLELAHQGLEIIESMYEGLAEEESSLARQRSSDIFAAGALAGAALEDVPETVHFLESGRAGALLDLLGRRERMRWQAESLPEDLRKAQAEAAEAQRIAESALARALRRGDMKRRKKAEARVDEANAMAKAVTDRIQRAMKGKDDLFYPRARPVEEIAEGLEGDEALVLYGLVGVKAIAVVIREDDQRIVELGLRKPIEEACAALDMTSTDEDPKEALAALRKLIVEPLALEKDVKQVLVSPSGALSYLPFSALIDKTVSMTPSGTTHLMLLEDARRTGKGRLGIGDAKYTGATENARETYYRGRSLSALPATRIEIDKVATTKLLGAEANETRFREALGAKKRWQSVHFACHGLIDASAPELSSLALTKTDADDGFLTMREILRMKIPADLAVLSACETGRGQVIDGEGIRGLTRAFMFAGCPRVICSLWKVDDEATRALMVKFYELWNGTEDKPGLPIADALRGAQEHVRSQAKWKHPYYWGAWVLWGPPR